MDSGLCQTNRRDQFLFFSVLNLRFVDLLRLVLHQRENPLLIACLPAPLLVLRLLGVILLQKASQLPLQCHRSLIKAVQQINMATGVEQRLVFMLSVNINQKRCCLLQGGGRHNLFVQPIDGTSVRRDPPG